MVRDAGGRPSGVRGLMVDISERKRIEEALEQQTKIHKAILDNMNDGVVVADVRGKFLAYNPAAERIAGVGPSEEPPGEWSRIFGLFRPDGVTPFPPEELPLARAIRCEPTDAAELWVRH